MTSVSSGIRIAYGQQFNMHANMHDKVDRLGTAGACSWSDMQEKPGDYYSILVAAIQIAAVGLWAKAFSL